MNEQKLREKKVYGSGATADWGGTLPRRDRKKSKRTRVSEAKVKKAARNGAKAKIDRQAKEDER